MRVIKNNKINGFTLVELLIAISLIAILSGVLFSVINPLSIQKKTRDAQRKADLTKIMVALESYFADNRSYPVKSDGWGLIGNGASDTLRVLKPNYVNVLPTDPKANNLSCDNSNPEAYGYYYRSTATGSTYALATNLELYVGTPACPTGINCTGCGNWKVYYVTPE